MKKPVCRILVTTNLSEPPESYFAAAANLARQLAEPVLLHVFDLIGPVERVREGE